MASERNGQNAVQSFRSKYPGAYDRYSDSELLDAIKRKYPGKYEDLSIQVSIPKQENVLQRVTKAIGSAAQAGIQNAGNPLGFEVNPNFPFIPKTPIDNSAIQAGLGELGPGVSVGSNLAAGLRLGGGPAVKGIAKGTKGAIRSVRNPSKVFGEGIGKLQKSNPNKKVDFFKILSDASSDPKASKVLQKSGALERFGGQNMDEGGAIIEKLSNLTLQDSQDLVNMVKDGVRQAVKEGTVKPTEIGIAKMFSELSKAQKGAFKGFDKVARNYGVSKNLNKAAKKYAKTALWGGVGGTAFEVGRKLIKG